jgi:aspartyl-tRNA(Asn)/glutamyl-tRNA(Gln) amidotransferase subunit A
MGTTNLHELAYGITSANPHFGVVQNPSNAEHIAGGSSGGSAAAVAAGIVDIAIGTDTAGSIRIPAACCGVVGFKPTYDAVPRAGVLDLGPTLDHVGPLASSVSDAALAFSVMAGQPGLQPASLSSLSGVRVGIPSSYFFQPLQPQVAHAMSRAIERMKLDGAEIVSVDIPGLQNCAAIQLATLCPEATAVNWKRLVDAPETLGDDVRVRLEIGQFFPGIWYTRAQAFACRRHQPYLAVQPNRYAGHNTALRARQRQLAYRHATGRLAQPRLAAVVDCRAGGISCFRLNPVSSESLTYAP